jgi:hypothetical protein
MTDVPAQSTSDEADNFLGPWHIQSHEMLAVRGAMSFLRVFGPTTATPVPANQWTVVPLTGEWRPFGEPCWELVPASGDPDSASFAGCLRCLVEGVYDFTGAVIFDSSNQTGDRGVNVTELRGPYAGSWDLVQSTPMPKIANGAVLVAGETYQTVGNIVGLRANATVTTATTANPNSEFLSVTLISAAYAVATQRD